MGAAVLRRIYQVSDVTADESYVVLRGVLGYPGHIGDVSFPLTSI